MDGSVGADKESRSFNQDRLELRAYLEKESLHHLDDIFPDYISLDYFKSLTDDDLEHDFQLKDAKLRLQVMKAVIKCRDDDNSGNEEQKVSSLFSFYQVKSLIVIYLFCKNT